MSLPPHPCPHLHSSQPPRQGPLVAVGAVWLRMGGGCRGLALNLQILLAHLAALASLGGSTRVFKPAQPCGPAQREHLAWRSGCFQGLL